MFANFTKKIDDLSQKLAQLKAQKLASELTGFLGQAHQHPATLPYGVAVAAGRRYPNLNPN